MSAASLTTAVPLLLQQERLAAYENAGVGRTKGIEHGEIRRIAGRHARLKLLRGLARAGIGHDQLDFADGEHEIVFEGFDDRCRVVCFREERRICGGRFLQAEIATPRGQAIGLGKARGEHLRRDARRRDGTGRGAQPTATASERNARYLQCIAT